MRRVLRNVFWFGLGYLLAKNARHIPGLLAKAGEAIAFQVKFEFDNPGSDEGTAHLHP